MRENPTAARAVAGDKKMMQRKKTKNESAGDEPLSPALLQPLDEANSWCLALKSAMEPFGSNVREVQSLAREASRETSAVESSDEDLAKLAQDLETRLKYASTELEDAKAEAEKLYASSFLRSSDASPDSDGGAPPGNVPGSIPTTPPRDL
jgi:methyl-accepting chemotaxis protein